MPNLDRITLGKILDKILEKKEYWIAFSKFAVSVIQQKEEEERRREMIFFPSPPLRGGDLSD